MVAALLSEFWKHGRNEMPSSDNWSEAWAQEIGQPSLKKDWQFLLQHTFYLFIPSNVLSIQNYWVKRQDASSVTWLQDGRV